MHFQPSLKLDQTNEAAPAQTVSVLQQELLLLAKAQAQLSPKKAQKEAQISPEPGGFMALTVRPFPVSSYSSFGINDCQ